MIETIDKYESELFDIYINEDLVALRDHEYNYKGFEIHDLLNPPSKTQSESSRFHPIDNFHDLINCNSDLRHYTSLLFYYRPYVNIPEQEIIKHKDLTIYTYFQNMYDRRYCQFASICYEKLYNYCDRVGDFLANYYSLKIPQNKIYFDSVMSNLQNVEKLKTNIYFLKILSYWKSNYKQVNKFRIDIVHYAQYETSYRSSFNINATNENWQNLGVKKRITRLF